MGCQGFIPLTQSQSYPNRKRQLLLLGFFRLPTELHPRRQAAAEPSGRDDGEFYGAGHVGQGVGQRKNRQNRPSEKVRKAREIPPESSDSSGILGFHPDSNGHLIPADFFLGCFLLLFPVLFYRRELVYYNGSQRFLLWLCVSCSTLMYVLFDTHMGFAWVSVTIVKKQKRITLPDTFSHSNSGNLRW